MNDNFPKYQYSEFFKNGRDGQMVIRSNDWEEFKELKKKLDEIVAKHQPVQTTITTSTPICQVHNVPMIERTGQYGKFWSCPNKLQDGTWCKYKPQIK